MYVEKILKLFFVQPSAIIIQYHIAHRLIYSHNCIMIKMEFVPVIRINSQKYPCTKITWSCEGV